MKMSGEQTSPAKFGTKGCRCSAVVSDLAWMISDQSMAPDQVETGADGSEGNLDGEKERERGKVRSKKKNQKYATLLSRLKAASADPPPSCSLILFPPSHGPCQACIKLPCVCMVITHGALCSMSMLNCRMSISLPKLDLSCCHLPL